MPKVQRALPTIGKDGTNHGLGMPAELALARPQMPKALVALTPLFILPATVPANAQQADQRHFHVTHDTYGCTNPRAALAITNHDDPRQQDPGWVAFVIADGHCAPITPRSPWRVVSMQGELAYMTYAGTTGLPGSFYLRASDLAELAPAPTAVPQSPVPINQPLPAYTPPPSYALPTPLAESQPTTLAAPQTSGTPAPRNDAARSGYINPPEAAVPPTASRLAPAKPFPERQATPHPVVRKQPRPTPQAVSAPVYASTAGGDGFLAGAALAAFIMLACGLKWMGRAAAKYADAAPKQEPRT